MSIHYGFRTDKKSFQIHVQLSESEYNKLKEDSKRVGLSVSAYVRKVVLHK